MKWNDSQFGVRLNLTEVMVSGITKFQVELARRGIDEAFTTNLKAELVTATELNNEQENLKGQLKAKTEELDQKMVLLGALYSEAKKTVKLEFSQDVWKKFGMDDKR